MRRVLSRVAHQRFQQQQEVQRGAERGLRVVFEVEKPQRGRRSYGRGGLRTERRSREDGRVQYLRSQCLDRGVKRIRAEKTLAESLVVLHQHAQHAQKRVDDCGNIAIIR